MSGGGPFTALEATLEERRLQVEEALRRLAGSGRAPAVQAALEDSLYAPAKRLRPIVSLMVADVFRVDPRRVLPAGVAIEMVHTASLILDDLPSMDDARSRRGRPACHVAHGEASRVVLCLLQPPLAHSPELVCGNPRRKPSGQLLAVDQPVRLRVAADDGRREHVHR